MPDEDTRIETQDTSEKEAANADLGRSAAQRGDEHSTNGAHPGNRKGKNPHGTQVHVAEGHHQLTQLVKAAHKKSGGNMILVPVDFSDYSEAALVWAAKFAETMPAIVVVLHVVHDPGEMPGYYSKLIKKKRVARIQDIAAEAFHDFMKGVINKHPDLKTLRKAENLMVIGLPVTRILQVVEKLDPQLVVMGSQGRTGLKHIMLGSKAEQVVQLCPVPVTVVKIRK